MIKCIVNTDSYNAFKGLLVNGITMSRIRLVIIFRHACAHALKRT